jgi:hypothetical protein
MLVHWLLFSGVSHCDNRECDRKVIFRCSFIGYFSGFHIVTTGKAIEVIFRCLFIGYFFLGFHIVTTGKAIEKLYSDARSLVTFFLGFYIVTTGKAIEKFYSDARSLVTFSWISYCDNRESDRKVIIRCLFIGYFLESDS